MGTAKTLLIDGDILLFKFAFRHQNEITWGNNAKSLVLNDRAAKADTDHFISGLKRKLSCKDYLVVFTSKLNFRYSVLSTYKHNRVGKEPPKMLKIIKDHIRFNHPWISWDYCEADDTMGILGSSDPDKYILATIDKDFKTIPCNLFLWNKKSPFPVRISQDDADYWFHIQWLTGDTTDGYGGLHRVGIKKAEKILAGLDPSEYTDAVLAEYMDRCYTYTACLQQARMARILRHTDWDYNRKRPILWTPHS